VIPHQVVAAGQVEVDQLSECYAVPLDGCVPLESSASLKERYPEARVLDRDTEQTVLREQNLFLLLWEGGVEPALERDTQRI
jgi:trans-aconitate methyltransferase